MMVFAYKECFWLIFLPLFVYYFLPAMRKMYGDALKIPFIEDIMRIKQQFKSDYSGHANVKVSYKKLILMFLIWSLTVLALSRPQWTGEPRKVQNMARDILLVVDISNSMNERDFIYKNRYYDRLTAVKGVVADFVDKRTEDRLGLVLFGTRAYMQVPLTFDKQSLKGVLQVIEAGMAGNSTSIGDAVGVALKNLQNSDSKNEKVIILLTDGENNDGKLSLEQAIALAEEENVRIYTIGVGSEQKTFLDDLFGFKMSSDLDEKGLQKLAKATEGTYFRADNVNSLQEVYAKIDKLEPQINESRYVQDSKDLFYYPAAFALLLFIYLILLVRRGI